MKKTLKIDLAQEYKLRIEDYKDFKNSFFNEIYERAFTQIDGIVRWSFANEPKDDCNKNKENTFFKENRENNNLIAFVGERGTGKSSAMISVAKALIDKDGKEIFVEKRKAVFESLHTIDPSRFEKNQNIIEVIVAELFEKFQELITENCPKKNENEKREVLKAFQDVYKCLKIINPCDDKCKYENDPLETLSKFSDATKLQEKIQELIRLYLKYVSPENGDKKNMLIIPIDDFDLNVKHAGMMAEQIRKYLMIPNVLILMAINIEQFGDVKTQDVIDDFKVLMSESRMSESPRDVAARYILKLIPIERRISISNLSLVRNDFDFELGFEINPSIDKTNLLIYSNNDIKFEESIIKYLYDNTGLQLVYNNSEYHPFLPETLREFKSLCFVFGSFNKLPDNSFPQFENNLKIIENYFLNIWTKDYLLVAFNKMILESKTLDFIKWNKFFITRTIEVLSKEKKYENDWKQSDKLSYKIFENDIELQLIVDRNNHESNISLGDFIYFYSFLKNFYLYDKEIKKLVVALNFWYSINLTKFQYVDESTKRKNLVDIVNGTIVNKKMDLIRETTDQLNRIEFRINLDEITILKGSNYRTFLTKNIFVNHSIANNSKYRKYRVNEGIVLKEEPKTLYDTPTINLFSFVFKDENNLFPIPYNNLEQWQNILNSIDKDYKGQAKNDPAQLLLYLFESIYKLLPNNLKQLFIKNEIISYLINSKSEFGFDDKNREFKNLINEIYKNALPNERIIKTNVKPKQIEEKINDLSLLEDYLNKISAKRARPMKHFKNKFEKFNLNNYVKNQINLKISGLKSVNYSLAQEIINIIYPLRNI